MHSKPLPESLNIAPVKQLYSILLITRYKKPVKNNDPVLIYISSLTKAHQSYVSHSLGNWNMPFGRTDLCQQMLQSKLPLSLNELMNKSVNPFPLTNKMIKEVLFK